MGIASRVISVTSRVELSSPIRGIVSNSIWVASVSLFLTRRNIPASRLINVKRIIRHAAFGTRPVGHAVYARGLPTGEASLFVKPRGHSPASR